MFPYSPQKKSVFSDATIVMQISVFYTFAMLITVLVGPTQIVEPHRSEVVCKLVQVVVVSLQLHASCRKDWLPWTATNTVEERP